MRLKKNQLVQLFSYGLVGVISLLLDLLVTVVLFNIFNFPAYLASAVGFMTGFLFNFPMNRKKVFHHGPHDRYSLKEQVSMYLSLSILNLFVTSFLSEILVSSHIVKIGYAKLIVTALIAVWNFLLFKFVIFSKKLPN